MAEVKVLLNSEEIQEKEELATILENMKKSEKDMLAGFLKGLAFSKQN